MSAAHDPYNPDGSLRCFDCGKEPCVCGQPVVRGGAMSDTVQQAREWWINEALRVRVTSALEHRVQMIEARCAESGCMCDLRGRECAQDARDDLHEWESELHLLDQRLADEREQCAKVADKLSSYAVASVIRQRGGAG